MGKGTTHLEVFYKYEEKNNIQIMYTTLILSNGIAQPLVKRHILII